MDISLYWSFNLFAFPHFNLENTLEAQHICISSGLTLGRGLTTFFSGVRFFFFFEIVVSGEGLDELGEGLTIGGSLPVE